METTEKKKNWFVKHKIITGVIVVIVVLIVVGAAGGSKTSTTNTPNTNNNPTTNNQTATVKQNPTIVDSTALVGEFDKNKIAAQDKYTGKFVQTTAYISNISNDFTGNYYLSLKPTNDNAYFGTSISCYFADKSAKSEIISLENGQSVTVQGAMADMSIGIVVMNDCKVIK
jgi:hypothetical protein